MEKIKQILGGDPKQYTMVMALIILVLFFQFMTGGLMMTPSNFQNLISGNAYVLVLAIGMLMVIIVGHIDLSVGSVAAFSSMSLAILAQQFDLPWWLAIFCGLGIGILVGAWQGFWVAKLAIPGFITTLAGMMIFRGGVIWISGSISVPVPRELRLFGAGYLPEWGPAFTSMNNSTLLLGLVTILAYVYSQIKEHKGRVSVSSSEESFTPVLIRIIIVSGIIAYLTWLFATGRPGTSFPVPGIILVILVIVYHIVTTRTKFGRHIYAVGGNKNAAALSGVNVKKIYFYTMLNMSFLAALAGIMFVGRSTSAGPSDGTGWELDAIASVFIGGASVAGGTGTVMATMVGGLIMAVLNNGLMLMGVGADKTQVIKGLVLLAAVAFDVYNKTQGKPSITGKLFGSKTQAEK